MENHFLETANGLGSVLTLVSNLNLIFLKKSQLQRFHNLLLSITHLLFQPKIKLILKDTESDVLVFVNHQYLVQILVVEPVNALTKMELVFVCQSLLTKQIVAHFLLQPEQLLLLFQLDQQPKPPQLSLVYPLPLV
jgi:hypothetical protein